MVSADAATINKAQLMFQLPTGVGIFMKLNVNGWIKEHGMSLMVLQIWVFIITLSLLSYNLDVPIPDLIR